jgi:hypothetical protein
MGVAAIPGDTFRLSFVSDDDVGATVTLLADADQNPLTTNDQTPLYVGADGNGAQQDVTATVPTLAPGVYGLVLRADDGSNPPVEVYPSRPLFVYRGVAGVNAPKSNRCGVIGSTVVFSRGEAEDGAGPLNGDGFADDGVFVALDSVTGTVTQPSPSVSMDVTPVAGGRLVPLQRGGNVLAWITREIDENANLNGGNTQSPNAPIGGADTDTSDLLVSYVVAGPNPTPVTNTYAGATSILDVVGNQILAHVRESDEGAGGTDRNADGDSLDSFFGYVDPNVPGGPYEFNQWVFFAPLPLPAVGTAFRHKGPAVAAYLGAESGGGPGGGSDLNADGDTADVYLHVVDLTLAGGLGKPGNLLAVAGTQMAPAAPPTPVDPAGGFDVSADLHAAYYVNEAQINLAPGGVAGNDVNGDGLVGFVPAIYDVAAGQQILPAGVAGPLDAPPGSATMIYDGTRLFFVASEGGRADPGPGTNGDADAGADMQILYWTDHTAGTPPPAQPLAVNFGGGLTLQALALDGGGAVASLAPGWLAVAVTEAANGNQDINGDGIVDMAYLLVDTTTSPAPTVYNPKLVPSAAGTIPLTGVWGEDPLHSRAGVVVRLTEAANGDLDGDGNNTETFLGLLRTDNPTNLILLDAGGDCATVANGRIGVTAQEAFTGKDYDGNGSATDTVFRVLDFTGAVLEPGRLCSPLSVPVTDNGDLWAYLRDENVEGRSLNGDADQTDLVLGLWIP